MTIDVTAWSMTSDRTPESAHRVTDSTIEVWRLSWLPDRELTRGQARAGMEFDELLGDPGAVDDPTALARMDSYAGELGIATTDAVLRIARRMAARLAPPAEPESAAPAEFGAAWVESGAAPAESGAAPAERTDRPLQPHGRAIDPPYVLG
ncbi:hypothetical protein OG203_02760 [Nocardia sp. NBC_01499]|uniref:hypothetical protein n=1 Tax=Nocardia sp. NBC_01499 TaxID=2903597 RepID=UPI00386891E6